MKTQKAITITTVILLIAIISLASFVGIYIKDEYKVSNIVPDYILGMEFTDSRVISLEVDKSAETIIYDNEGNEITAKEEGIEYTEENGYTTVENKTNPDEILTIDNYKKTKSILKNRLKALGIDQYRITLDETTGNMQIRIPENEDTDTAIYNLLQSGTFELKDSETEEVLIYTNAIKSADVVYSQGETETSVYLQIKLNKEGKQKLEEISKLYVETTSQTTNQEGETEETTETKNVGLYLSGELVTETYFGDTITDGTLNIAVGKGSDSATIEQYAQIANESAAILNSGTLPITYTEMDYSEVANITKQQKDIALYGALGLLALLIVIFIIRLKTKGILASLLQIGYIALLLLVLRYTNVKITIEGVCGIVLGSIINFVYIYKSLKNAELNFIKEVTVKFSLKLIPVYIIAIILSFNSIANVYSLGMTLVWASLVMYLYNLTLTQVILKNIKKEQ